MTVQRELERCRKRWKKAPAEVDRASMQLLNANGPIGGDEFNASLSTEPAFDERRHALSRRRPS